MGEEKEALLSANVREERGSIELSTEVREEEVRAIVKYEKEERSSIQRRFERMTNTLILSNNILYYFIN